MLDFQLPAEMFAANIQAGHEVAVERTSFLRIWWCAEILATEAPRPEPASHGTRWPSKTLRSTRKKMSTMPSSKPFLRTTIDWSSHHCALANRAWTMCFSLSWKEWRTLCRKWAEMFTFMARTRDSPSQFGSIVLRLRKWTLTTKCGRRPSWSWAAGAMPFHNICYWTKEATRRCCRIAIKWWHLVQAVYMFSIFWNV